MWCVVFAIFPEQCFYIDYMLYNRFIFIRNTFYLKKYIELCVEKNYEKWTSLATPPTLNLFSINSLESSLVNPCNIRFSKSQFY